jgi:hypothetical protein
VENAIAADMKLAAFINEPKFKGYKQTVNDSRGLTTEMCRAAHYIAIRKGGAFAGKLIHRLTRFSAY